MFRLRLTVLLLSFFTAKFYVNAQKITPQFGIRMGYTFSGKYGSSFFHMPQYSRLELSPGIFMRFPLSKDFSLSSEINYVQKGFRIDSVQVYSDCIRLNLLSNIRLGITKTHLTLGPFVSYLLHKSIHTPQEKSLELGGTIGLGFELSQRLRLESRYHASSEIWEFDYGLLRNTFLEISLTHTF